MFCKTTSRFMAVINAVGKGVKITLEVSLKKGDTLILRWQGEGGYGGDCTAISGHSGRRKTCDLAADISLEKSQWS